jgi:hypothetical protein
MRQVPEVRVGTVADVAIQNSVPAKDLRPRRVWYLVAAVVGLLLAGAGIALVVAAVSRRWTVERGADGGIQWTEDFLFDSAELKTPLQEAVLSAGWTWRGVLFKL